ncbi:MAG: M23 family metallopeptidase [Bacillota bacterium]|nr:M23 family metallopeptidase [Bacillota bacterium]
MVLFDRKQKGSGVWLRWRVSEPARWGATIGVIVLLIALVSYANPQLWRGEPSEQLSAEDAETLRLAAELDQQLDQQQAAAAMAAVDGAAAAPEDGATPEDGAADTATATDTAAADGDDGADARTLPAELDYSLPLQGELLRGVGYCYESFFGDWRYHRGVDLAAAAGAAVYAAADGVVSEAADDRIWGGVIVLDHGAGLCSVYRGITVQAAVGDVVRAGDIIGSVGEPPLAEAEQDSHLHFELVLNGEALDPLEY